MNPATNARLSGLLWSASEAHEGHRARALRRASRAALLWPVEAAAVVDAGLPLTSLAAVGPWVAGLLEGWLEDPPQIPPPPPERAGFLSMAQARSALESHPPMGIRADLQVHTTYSDGRNTLEEMVDAAADRGLEYVAITDHSKGLPIANGMDEARLGEQGTAIEELNRARSGEPRVLRAIEMNLSPLGEGDMDPADLRRLDLVLGAFHSKLRVKEDQTERYLAALRNPLIDVLAHPRGRRLGVRLGLGADWKRVIGEAAARDVALEVDAFPDRQDLDVDLLRLVAEEGGRISIGSDAHGTAELEHLDLGIGAAALAGIPPDRILNTMSADDLVEWARARRG